MARYEVFCNATIEHSGYYTNRDGEWSVIVGPDPDGIFFIAIPNAGNFDMAKEAADALNAAAEKGVEDGNSNEDSTADSSGR